SVAVVLRGNLEQTLTRRNARVLGTLFGCILVVALFGSRSPSFTEAVFLVSVGIAHSFINVRYWVTATAATVMALLQAHLADPGVGFALGERLADTVLGAALGWAFSYVLPSWERQSVPDAVARALAALDGYARRVLAPASDDAVELRLARRNAYDALGAVAAAMQRSTVEPKRARLPVTELAVFLDHGQRLMAHLSSVRLILVRRAAALPEPEVGIALRAAMTELSEHLAPAPDAAPADAEARELWPDTIPEDPPTADPLPWLLRRLQLSVDAARRVEVAVGAIDARLR
ncbi:MAG: FUSC family protein, partial [Caldimonas sp.]